MQFLFQIEGQHCFHAIVGKSFAKLIAYNEPYRSGIRLFLKEKLDNSSLLARKFKLPRYVFLQEDSKYFDEKILLARKFKIFDFKKLSIWYFLAWKFNIFWRKRYFIFLGANIQIGIFWNQVLAWKFKSKETHFILSFNFSFFFIAIISLRIFILSFITHDDLSLVLLTFYLANHHVHKSYCQVVLNSVFYTQHTCARIMCPA